ncbi:MAG: glycosyltransferase family 2 protein [Clostridia bacterium]|nr:glycosyltransferase family 2 protein [Clostridia bacterium]
MAVIKTLNMILGAFFMLLYAYQIFYIFIPFLKKDKPHKETKMHRYGVLISARNEENVIANLIASIRRQDYPAELVDVYVIADNCTDSTATVASEAGANVFVRHDLENIGKGYALDYAIGRIFDEQGEDYYDGFFVFDADNILDRSFITEMNKTFSDGYSAITSYRNSTNYGANWISAGYGLWYIRESAYVSHSRMLLGTNCAVSGTGFLVSKELLKKSGGWKYHLLTEDIEFSISQAINGEKVGFCKDAIIYDEQPISFKQSWKQRLRWARGFFQVFLNYGGKLFKGIFSRRWWTSYDMLVTVLPVNVITLVLAIMNSVAFTIQIANGEIGWWIPILSLLQWCGRIYAMLFIMGLVAIITEAKRIRTSTAKQVIYLFSFPLFQLTYIPVSILALFTHVKWEPTRHHGPTADAEKLEDKDEYID